LGNSFYGFFFFLPFTNLTPPAMPTSPYMFDNNTDKYYANASDNAAVQIYHENTADAFAQLWGFPPFLLIEIFILTSIAFFNFFGLTVTRKLSAVHRTLIDACRTIFVWAVQVILYYSSDQLKGVGEQLTLISLIQLAGFVFLVFGTLIYNEVIKLPWSIYEYKKIN